MFEAKPGHARSALYGVLFAIGGIATVVLVLAALASVMR